MSVEKRRGVASFSSSHEPSGGFSLIELLVVLAVIGMFVSVSTPAFLNLRRQAAMRAATKELRGILQLTRSRAIARGRNCAVKFRLIGGEWRYAIYEDGDFDGVRNDDITSGVDPIVVPFRRVLQGGGPARMAIPLAGARDPDTNQPLTSGDSPVRFNSSTLCSFSPQGSGTAGTVFLSDGFAEAGAVRVFGATGRIRSQMYNRARGKWESR